MLTTNSVLVTARRRQLMFLAMARFFVMALGKSIVAVGVGASDLTMNVGTLSFVVLTLFLSVALWWIYSPATTGEPRTVFRGPPAKSASAWLSSVSVWRISP